MWLVAVTFTTMQTWSICMQSVTYLRHETTQVCNTKSCSAIFYRGIDRSECLCKPRLLEAPCTLPQHAHSIGGIVFPHFACDRMPPLRYNLHFLTFWHRRSSMIRLFLCYWYLDFSSHTHCGSQALPTYIAYLNFFWTTTCCSCAGVQQSLSSSFVFDGQCTVDYVQVRFY